MLRDVFRDGDQSDHQNARKDFTADMRAARGEFPELDLDRLWDALHQGATSLGQGQDHLAPLSGQLYESARDRLVGFGAVVARGDFCVYLAESWHQRPRRQSRQNSGLLPQETDRPTTIGGELLKSA